MSRRLRPILQLTVSVGLVGLLLWWMPDGTLSGLAGAAPGWVLAGVLAYLAGQTVSGLRFFFLVAPALAVQAGTERGARSSDTNAPQGTETDPQRMFRRQTLTPWMAVRATILGTFAGTFLPVNAGGDVIKLAWLTRRLGGDSAPVVAAGMVVERLSGVLVTLAFCGAVGAALSLEWRACGLLPGKTALILLVACAALGGAGLVLLTRSAAPWAERARELLRRAGAAVRWWRDHPGRIAACLGFSLLNLLCGSLVILVLGAAVGQHLTALQALAAIGLTTLTTYLPISISGLGVMEAGLAGLLTVFAYPPATAVQVAVLLRLVGVAAVLPGAFFWRGRT